MEKSPDAFRTISEVAEWLDVPTHVLRFWESRFAQVKPVKRAGGRRYYRPGDMLLIGGIKKLLHEDGMTIRGVQKMLREEGVKHVSGFSQSLDGEAAPVVEGDVAEAEPTSGEVVPLERNEAVAEPEVEPVPEAVAEDEPVEDVAPTFGSRRTITPDAAPEQLSLIDEAEIDDTGPPPRPDPIPLPRDVPEVDAEDDDAQHSRAAGVVSRLLTRDRHSPFATDGTTIEAVVNRLRAARDRTN
ncbi:MAG: MerR family transcriptional regulator [Pseudomonadota bacterium]